MHALIENILTILKGKRFNLTNETTLQAQLQVLFSKHIQPHNIKREYILDKNNKIDFFLFNGIGVEVKIHGQKRAIYRQCERYCKFDQVKCLLLITNQSMGFPKEINGKDCYVFNLSKAYL